MGDYRKKELAEFYNVGSERSINWVCGDIGKKLEKIKKLKTRVERIKRSLNN